MKCEFSVCVFLLANAVHCQPRGDTQWKATRHCEAGCTVRAGNGSDRHLLLGISTGVIQPALYQSGSANAYLLNTGFLSGGLGRRSCSSAVAPVPGGPRGKRVLWRVVGC